MSKNKNTKAGKSSSANEEYQINSLKDLTAENLKNVLLKNRYAQMLIVLVIVGFFLRFYNLAYNSVWLDEGATLDFAERSLSGIWEATAGGEFNPPLFYYMEHFMLMFGDSEFILRLLPALFGALTIPIFYLIGREITGLLGGVIAAALLTFSTFHIYYSQDARAYTTVLLFFSIAILFYLFALKSDALKYWILMGVFCSLAFWTHFYVFIGVGILFLHALIAKRNTLKENIKSIIPIAAGAVAFLIVSLPLIIVTIELFFIRTGSGPTWGLSGMDVITQTMILISGSELYLTVIFVLLALAGAAYLFITTEKRDYSYLIILSLILPFILSIILSSMLPMSPRYLIYILPFYFIAIAAAFEFIPKEIDPKKVAVVAIILLCLVSIPYLSTYYTSYSKNDWRGFSGALGDLTNDGDYVVVMPGYMTLALDYYYDSNLDKTHEIQATTSAELIEIENVRKEATAYYIITWDISAANPEGDALAWIDANAEFVGQNMGIYLFKSK